MRLAKGAGRPVHQHKRAVQNAAALLAIEEYADSLKHFGE